jgi:hypothetical protein
MMTLGIRAEEKCGWTTWGVPEKKIDYKTVNLSRMDPILIVQDTNWT